MYVFRSSVLVTLISLHFPIAPSPRLYLLAISCMGEPGYTFFESELLKSTDAISQIDDRFFIGSAAGAADLNLIRSLSIEAVIVCHPTLEFFHESLGIAYHRCPMKDLPTEPLYPHLESAIAFIDAHPKARILVHCSKGVSRSVSVVIGYLMTQSGKNFDSILAMVEQKRKIVYPNIGFQAQLVQLGDMLADGDGEWDVNARVRSRYFLDIVRRGIEDAVSLTDKAVDDPVAVYTPAFLLQCKRVGMLFENLSKYNTQMSEPAVVRSAMACQGGLTNLQRIFPKGLKGVQLCQAIAKQIREWLLTLDPVDSDRSRSRERRHKKKLRKHRSRSRDRSTSRTRRD